MHRFQSTRVFPVIPFGPLRWALAVVGAALLLTLGLLAGPGLAEAKKVIIAHRGASGYLPEHTLEAYALAYGQGSDYIEPDLVLTKDGVPIALHDRTLDATTNVAEVFPDRARDNGRYYPIDLTLEEIKMLEVRERVNAKTGEVASPGRFPNTHNVLKFRIPTLAELIELVRGLNHATGRNVGIYPELKAPGWHTDEGHDSARILLDVLTEYGYRTKSDAVVIQCFEPEALLRLRQLGCELRLVQLIGGKLDNPMLTPEGLDRIAGYADGIGPAIPLILDGAGNLIDNNALVTGAHARGLVVHPWTIRADGLPSYAASLDWLVERLLFDAGADGAFTDHPDQMAETLSRR